MEIPMTQKRLLSLDAFRGATIALMVLVNDPGGFVTYRQLQHGGMRACFPEHFLLLDRRKRVRKVGHIFRDLRDECHRRVHVFRTPGDSSLDYSGWRCRRCIHFPPRLHLRAFLPAAGQPAECLAPFCSGLCAAVLCSRMDYVETSLVFESVKKGAKGISHGARYQGRRMVLSSSERLSLKGGL